ncbi:hypothetical protein CLFE_047580 (plasmid) [Clostridium felsineum DSM 794]|nr:hypothetical protein CLFE_047580 [Clostridium felsineum DSM 794]
MMTLKGLLFSDKKRPFFIIFITFLYLYPMFHFHILLLIINITILIIIIQIILNLLISYKCSYWVQKQIFKLRSAIFSVLLEIEYNEEQENGKVQILCNCRLRNTKYYTINYFKFFINYNFNYDPFVYNTFM